MRLEAWLQTRTAGWILLGLLAVLYVWAYVHDPLNPGDAAAHQRQGWWSWADQAKYYQSANALAHGRIEAETYFYSLGYPALGALFVRTMPVHPFFWPNLALTLATGVLAWKLARRWFGPLGTLMLTGGYVITHASLLRLTMVVPWNTLPVQAALLGGFLLVLNRRDGPGLAWIAVLAALTYLTRPSDALAFGPLLVWATLRLPTWNSRVRWGAAGMLILAVTAAMVAWINWRTFGSWRTPYEESTMKNIGFFGYPTLHKLYGIFVDGETFFGEYGSALLWRYPWLFLGPPAAVFWARRDGWSGVACLAAIGLNWGLYVSYNDFLPSAIFRYSLVHYVSWGFIPLAIAAAAAIRHDIRTRFLHAALAGSLALFLLALGLKLKERPLPAEVAPGAVVALPARRPLWVSFPGERLHLAGSLRLDGRVMLESADYHIPYVQSDLRILLSNRAVGRRLAPENPDIIRTPPQVGDYVWSWWPRWRRLIPPRD